MLGDSTQKRWAKRRGIGLAPHNPDAAARYRIEPLERRLLLSTVTFTNSGGGSWNTPGNWSTGNVPQAADDVVINQPGNIQVPLTGNVSVKSVTITGDVLALQSGASVTTTANLTNSGTINVSPDGQISVTGNYSQTAGASLSMPGGGLTTVPLANLLANSTFETPTVASSGTTPPNGWSDFGSATLSNQYAYTGAQSIQMNGANSGVFQSFSVAPGTSYTLSVFAMSPAADRLTGSEAGYIQVLFFDAGGNQISSATAPNSVFVLYQSKAPGGPLAGSVGSDGWTAYNTAAVAPANAATAEAILLTNNLNGAGPGGGSTYWDDPQFGTSAPAPSTLTAAKVSNSGVITLGPTNTITTTGTFTQSATGTLDIQLGAAPATGDVGGLTVGGAATLAGTLESELVYGYVPSTNDIFTPIVFPSATGSFANMQLPGGAGYQFQSAVTFTNVVLSAVPTTPLITTINAAGTIHAANPTLLGTNLNWFDAALTTTQTQQMATAAGLTSYTFPGGGATDVFHFASSSNEGRSTITTIPQFAQFVQAVGGTGLITLDYGSASPQEAAAELAYFEGSPSDTTTIGTGIQWNDTTSQWQNVNWKTVGFWAALRGASPLKTDDGFNFMRLNHAAPFPNFSYWEIGNEQYVTAEVDHHGTAGPGGVSTGAKHDPATYAAFSAKFAGYATEILAAAGLPAISIGIDSGDPVGRSDNFWTRNVLADGLALGFIPGFISDHDYVQGPGGEGDENLLVNTVSNPASIYNWTTRYAAYQSLLQQTLAGQAANVHVMATEFNSVFSAPGKQSTSLVNGLFLADSIGSLLDSDYSGGFVWDLRNGWLTTNNNRPSLYGWRVGGDFGLIGDSHTNLPPSTNAYVPYPTYFAEQLASKIVQPGGVVVSASSNYQQFDAYAVMEPNGHLELLVINANPAASLTEQFNIAGFQPSGAAQFWQYGKTQDTAQSQSSTGASALATFSATLSVSGGSFTYAFPAYSMTVIDLTPQPKASVSAAVSGSTTAVPGKSMTYIFVVKNDGASPVTGVNVADVLPAGINPFSVTYVATDNGLGAAGYTLSGTGLISDTVILPAGSSITYDVSGNIYSSQVGSMTMTGSAATPAGITNTEANVSASTVANQSSSTVTLIPEAELGVAMNGANPLHVGQTDVYTIVVTNFQTTAAGSDAVGATIATDALAQFTGIHFSSAILYTPDNGATPTVALASGAIADGGAFNDTFNLSAGSIIEFTLTGTVAPGATGTIANTATVADPGIDAVSSNNLSSVTAGVATGNLGSVVGRSLFYGNSFWDTTAASNPTFSKTPDTALAPDKLALMPGQSAKFNNYSSYTLGINGIFVDLSGDTGNISPADFSFVVGNDNAPGLWSTAPTPTSISLYPGAGVNGSDRVQINWADGVILDQWLQVTAAANQTDTRLALPDVFYFGSAPDEVGNSVTDAFVNSSDDIAARNDIHSTKSDPATLENPHDFNRDSKVISSDEILARGSHTSRSNGLLLITPSTPGVFVASSATASRISTAPGRAVMAPVSPLILINPIDDTKKSKTPILTRASILTAAVPQAHVAVKAKPISLRSGTETRDKLR